jgi:carboxylate-amine ligase
VIRSVGVEEEFLLFHLDEPRLANLGDEVAEDAERRADGDAQFERELKQAQVELATTPAEDLAELAAELRRRRSEVVTAAAQRQARVVASATCPVPYRAATSNTERYHEMAERFAAIERRQLTCAMHVHVGVESDDEGVAVLAAVPPWLPVLAALSANSPFLAGRDTGHEGYRRMIWNRWPSAGPTVPFRDGAEYRATVAALVASGAARDPGMIYFDARLSADYPTVEIRVCDVCADAADAVVIAALCRALVSATQSTADLHSQRLELVRAAHWRAARWGMTEQLVDPRSSDGRLIGAWDAARELLDFVRPALDEAGDTKTVEDGLELIRERGTGAQRQRDAAGDRPERAVDAVALRC